MSVSAKGATGDWQKENEKVLELMQSGQIDKACDAAWDAVDLARREFGDQDPRLAVSLNNLGELCHMQGLLDEAGTALAESLAICETVHGKQSSETTEALMNLAELHLSREEYLQARQCIERVVDNHRQKDTDAHGHARAIHLLAMILQGLGLLDESLMRLQEGTALVEKKLDSLDPLNGLYAKSIGVHLLQQGKVDDAEKMLRKALKNFESSLGPDDAHVGTTLSLLAEVFVAKGQVEAGLSFMGQAAGLLQENPEADPMDTGSVYERMAQIYTAVGNKSKAEEFYRIAAEIYDVIPWDGALAVARVKNDFGEMLLNDKRPQEAIDLLLEAGKIREDHFGSSNPMVAQTLNNLGVGYSMQNELTIALKHHHKALSIREEVFGDEHPAITQSLENIAAIYRVRGQLDKAEELLGRCIEIWQKAEGDEHPAVAQTHHNLATLFITANRDNEAEEHLFAAKKILEKSAEANTQHLAIVYETLSEMYKKLGRTADANEYAARTTKIRKPEYIKPQQQVH